MSRDTAWIESEADFVDEVILHVGKRKAANRSLIDSCFGRQFALLLAQTDLQQQLPPLVTPEDRVEFVGKHFTGLCIPQEVLKKYERNAEVSRLLLNRGTELYKLKQFNGALHYYNLALMFAEKDTQSMGFAYANRAAVLVSLGHFKEAIQDVNSALKNKYPESQTEKLVQRKDRCEKTIQKDEEEQSAVDPKVKKELEAEIQKLKKMRDDMLKVHNPNPLIPAAAEFVEIKYDKVQGRHLAVNEDIPAGTVLLVEDPYMFTLYGQSKWDTEHCHHCLKRTWNGIPCENCVFAIYCGDSCRLEAKSMHDYECKILPSFHAIYTSDSLLTAVRIILKVGAKELFRIFETKDPEYLNPAEPFGTTPDSIYDSQSYLSVYHLVGHPEKKAFTDRCKKAANALIAAEILDASTPFFGDIPAVRTKEFKNFVAATITRHWEAANVNAGVLIELLGLGNLSFEKGFSGKIAREVASDAIGSLNSRLIGGVVYPLVSLINHSCDPNVSPLNHATNGKMVVMAHRAMQKGEALHVMYNGGFCFMDINTRQAHLDGSYHFTCHCIACEENWPTTSKLLDRGSMYCCPSCSKKLHRQNKGSNEFQKCSVTCPRWKCGSCGKIYKEAELKRKMRDNVGLVMKLPPLLQAFRFTEAYETFLKASDFLQFHLCPPNGILYSSQDFFRKAMLFIFHYAQQL